MRIHFYSTEDREYLEELIGYFPVSSPVSLEVAHSLIRARCQSWDPAKIVNLTIDRFGTSGLSELLPELPNLLHKAMFKDILSNAGEFRKCTDPNGGIVEFGLPIKKLTDSAGSSSGRFTGISTDKIEDELTDIFNLLSQDHGNHFENAALFYQKFIRIHPFYDGNGRIGRFIVDTYLYAHNMYIDWERMKCNTRWIRQLNYCHRKYGSGNGSLSYNYAIKWWIYHLNKFLGTVLLEENVLSDSDTV